MSGAKNIGRTLINLLRRFSSGSGLVVEGASAAVMALCNRAHSASKTAIERRCGPTQAPTRIRAMAGGMRTVNIMGRVIEAFLPVLSLSIAGEQAGMPVSR